MSCVKCKSNDSNQQLALIILKVKTNKKHPFPFFTVILTWFLNSWNSFYSFFLLLRHAREIKNKLQYTLWTCCIQVQLCIHLQQEPESSARNSFKIYFNMEGSWTIQVLSFDSLWFPLIGNKHKKFKYTSDLFL